MVSNIFFRLIWVVSLIGGSVSHSSVYMDALLDVGEYLKPRGRVPEDVFFREVLDTDAGMNGEILNRATRNKRQAVDPQYAVSARCMNHTLVYLSALLSREQWAMRSESLDHLYLSPCSGIFMYL